MPRLTSEQVRERIRQAAQLGVTPDEQDHILAEPYPKFWAVLARNPDLTVTNQTRLAKDPAFASTWVDLAKRDDLTSEALELLSGADRRTAVHEALVANPATPANALEVLYEYGLRDEMVTHPNLPEHIQVRMVAEKSLGLGARLNLITAASLCLEAQAVIAEQGSTGEVRLLVMNPCLHVGVHDTIIKRREFGNVEALVHRADCILDLDSSAYAYHVAGEDFTRRNFTTDPEVIALIPTWEGSLRALIEAVGLTRR